MLSLIFTLAIVGLLVWAVTTFIPMGEPFKTGIYVVAVVCIIWYLMTAFGVKDVPLPGN